MLRPLRVLLVFALLLLAAGAFTASAPADDDDDDGGGSPPQLVDRTFGKGTADFVGGLIQATFDFDVTSGPDGGAAAGRATVTTTNAGGVVISGTATCLKVSGSLAWFEINNDNPLGPDAVVYVGDFGPVGMGAGNDHFNFDFLGEEADAVCTGTQGSEQSVRSGDIVVQDNVLVSTGGNDDDDDDDDDDDEDDEDDEDDDEDDDD